MSKGFIIWSKTECFRPVRILTFFAIFSIFSSLISIISRTRPSRAKRPRIILSPYGIKDDLYLKFCAGSIKSGFSSIGPRSSELRPDSGLGVKFRGSKPGITAGVLILWGYNVSQKCSSRWILSSKTYLECFDNVWAKLCSKKWACQKWDVKPKGPPFGFRFFQCLTENNSVTFDFYVKPF